MFSALRSDEGVGHCNEIVAYELIAVGRAG
jgi:hypothetical protein